MIGIAGADDALVPGAKERLGVSVESFAGYLGSMVRNLCELVASTCRYSQLGSSVYQRSHSKVKLVSANANRMSRTKRFHLPK